MAVVSGFLVLCPTAPGRFDGVADYACWLTAHLTAHAPARLIGLADAGPSSGAEDPPCRARAARETLSSWRELWARRREPAFSEGAALLQYVPQLYLPRLDFVWLLAWLVHVRLHRRAVVVTAHEYTVPASGSITHTAASVLFRFVMFVLGVLATHVVATFELNGRRLRRLLFWKAGRVMVVPVGSNIPRAPGATGSGPETVRDRVECVIFGQPSAMDPGLVTALGNWQHARRDRVRVRWVGRSRHEVLSFWHDRCGLQADALEIVEAQPGPMVSGVLLESDLFLAPVADGVSTRRTTVMAALAHGLPIVGTDGVCTDDVLRRPEACLLSAAGDAAAFVRHVEMLVADPARRAPMARAARALFEERFTWERIALAYLAQLAPDARAR